METFIGLCVTFGTIWLWLCVIEPGLVKAMIKYPWVNTLIYIAGGIAIVSLTKKAITYVTDKKK